MSYLKYLPKLRVTSAASGVPVSKPYLSDSGLSLWTRLLADWFSRMQCATSRVVTLVLVALLRTYRLVVSPLLGQRCRFYPTCSRYAQESVERFGPVRGGWYALRRLLRCGPWHPGGVDLVPDPQGEECSKQ